MTTEEASRELIGMIRQDAERDADRYEQGMRKTLTGDARDRYVQSVMVTRLARLLAEAMYVRPPAPDQPAAEPEPVPEEPPGVPPVDVLGVDGGPHQQ